MDTLCRYFMSGGSNPVRPGAYEESLDGKQDDASARRRRQASNRELFTSSDALSGGDPPWPSLGIGGVGHTTGEDPSGASQVCPNIP